MRMRIAGGRRAVVQFARLVEIGRHPVPGLVQLGQRLGGRLVRRDGLLRVERQLEIPRGPRRIARDAVAAEVEASQLVVGMAAAAGDVGGGPLQILHGLRRVPRDPEPAGVGPSEFVLALRIPLVGETAEDRQGLAMAAPVGEGLALLVLGLEGVRQLPVPAAGLDAGLDQGDSGSGGKRENGQTRGRGAHRQQQRQPR